MDTSLLPESNRDQFIMWANMWHGDCDNSCDAHVALADHQKVSDEHTFIAVVEAVKRTDGDWKESWEYFLLEDRRRLKRIV